MSNEFSADEGQSEDGMRFARLNLDAEIEPCFFDEWITKRYGKRTILKETIGDWIVTLSFSGIGHILKSTDPPALWEVAEYNKGVEESRFMSMHLRRRLRDHSLTRWNDTGPKGDNRISEKMNPSEIALEFDHQTVIRHQPQRRFDQVFTSH